MKQVELSQQAASLVKKAALADEASDLELARVRQSIARAVATGAGPSLLPRRKLWRPPLVVIVATVAVVGGSGAYYLASPIAEQDPPVHEALPPIRVPVIQPLITPTPPEAPLGTGAAAPAPSAGTATHRRHTTIPPRLTGADSLTAELRLMRLAQEAVSREDAESALEIVDEHARRFPNGVLSEERTGVHIMALCALGRGRAAHRMRRQFEAAHPASPFIPRIARSCD